MIDTNTPADDRLAAFILSRSLYKEGRVLDSQIKTFRGLIDDDVERWAAIEQNRRAIELQIIIDETEEDLNYMQWAKVNTGDFNQRQYKGIYEKQRAAARELEDIQRSGPPVLGLLDEDLDAIYSIVSNSIEDMDNATMKLRDARALVANLDQPFRKREMLEAQIPLIHGRMTEMRQNNQALKESIALAVSRGEGTVRYAEWKINFDPIDWSIEEAERKISYAPAHMRPELQRKLRLAKERRARARNVTKRQAFTTEPRVQMAYGRVNPFRGQQIEMTIEEANARLASNATQIGSMADLQKMWELQLSVLDGTAVTRQKRLARLLLDETDPPDPARLEADNAELVRRAELRAGALTQEERDTIAFNKARIENITRPQGPGQPNRYGGYGMTPDDFERTTNENEQLTQIIARYKELHKGDEDFIARVIDNGNQWFDDLVKGTREPNEDDIEMLIQLLGGEQGQYANTFIRTLKNALYGQPRVAGGAPRPAQISLGELDTIFREISYALGDTSLGERMANRVATMVTDTGELNEGALKAMQDELYMSLVATANRERTERITDFSDTLKNLGFEFFLEDRNAIPMTGVPPGTSRANLTLNEKMHRLGYEQSKERFTPAKLRLFILQRFEQMGYDVKKSLENQLNDLLMRSQRLDTMRRGLGGQVNIRHMKDADAFWLRMVRGRELNAAEDAGNIASDADMYRLLSVPDDINVAYNQREAALQTELQQAIASNDADAINHAMELYEDFKRANGLPMQAPGAQMLPPPQALPPPEPAAALSPPMPAPAEIDPAVDARRLELANQRDSANAELAKVRIDINALGAERVGAADIG